MTAVFGRSKQVNSWDKFYIPMPFSKVTFKAKYIAYEDIKKQGQSIAAQALFLEKCLLALGEDPRD